MKILVLSSYNHSFNNRLPEIETFVGLQKQDAEVTVMAKGISESLDYYRKNGIEVIEDSPRKKIDSEYISRVKEKIVNENYDILHLLYGNTLRNGILAAFGTKVKVVAYFGSTSLHWHDITAYAKFLNPRVDKILCNSKHVTAHVKKQLLFNKEKATLVYKCFDTGWYNEYEPFNFEQIGIPKDSVIVTSVARNTKVKGVKYFLESTYHIPPGKNVHFVHVGKYMDKPNIKKLIENSPYRDNIHILGYRTDAIELIKGSDIYVQTSLDEGLGRAISEACMLKKPVVMTDAGGCTELIEANKGGFISELKKPKSIGENITKLIDDKDLRETMGASAYSYIHDNFNINTAVQNTYTEYRKLLG